MNEQQLSQDPHWGERCSVKLDMLISRVDRMTSLLFHMKGTFTADDAALYLGITPGHLYKLVRKYGIPHSRPTNGRIFFNKEDLDGWIRSQMSSDTGIDVPSNLMPPQEQYY